MKKFISLFLILASFYSFSQTNEPVVVDLSNPSYIYDRSKNIFLFDTVNFIHGGDTLQIIAGYNGGVVTLWRTTADTTYFVGLIKMDSMLIGYLHVDTLTVDTAYIKIAKIDTLISDTIYVLHTWVLNLYVDTLIADSSNLNLVVIDSLTMTSIILPDSDEGADIGTASLKFNKIHQDTAFANVYTNTSDMTLSETGSDITVNADTLKVTGAATVTKNLTVSDTTETTTFLTPYANTLNVAKSGGDYPTIQAAIDYAITQIPNFDSRWEILIHSGVYDEAITMHEYVDLKGVGTKTDVVITNAASVITLADSVEVSNLTIRTGATGDIYCFQDDGVVCFAKIMDVHMESTYTGGGGWYGFMCTAAGDYTFERCSYYITATAGGTGDCAGFISFNAAATIRIIDGDFYLAGGIPPASSKSHLGCVSVSNVTFITKGNRFDGDASCNTFYAEDGTFTSSNDVFLSSYPNQVAGGATVTITDGFRLYEVDDDDLLLFTNLEDATSETFGWDEGDDRFEMSDDLLIDGNLTVDSIDVAVVSIDSAYIADLQVDTLTCDTASIDKLKVDNLLLDGNTLSSTSGDINITPLAGEDVVIDTHFEFDGTTLTALTDNNTTITAYATKNITIESCTFDGGLFEAENLSSTDDADIVDNLTVGDIIIDEATGVLSFTGATSSAISSVADLTISTTANDEVINITPHGTGDVNISLIDVAGGEIDGTTIGANSETTGKFTTVQSTQATGTAPFTVASTTKVTNLNADKLDGSDWGDVTEIGSVTNCWTAWIDSLKACSPLYVYVDSVYFKRNIYVNDTIEASVGNFTGAILKDGTDITVGNTLSNIGYLNQSTPYSITQYTETNTNSIYANFFSKNTHTGTDAGIKTYWQLRDAGSNNLSNILTVNKTVNTSGSATTQFKFENYKSGALNTFLRANGDSIFFSDIFTLSGKSFFGDDMAVTGDIILDATGKIIFDGSGGHTYWAETSDDVSSLFVGNVEAVTVKEATNIVFSIDKASPDGVHTDFTSFQLGGNTHMTSKRTVGSSGILHLTQNANYDTDGSWEYISTDEASRYRQMSGTHEFYVVSSGTAGDDITWITSLTIEDDGKVVAVLDMDVGNDLTAGTITSDGNITINTGDTMIFIDPSGADSLMIYDNGTNSIFNSENPFSFNQDMAFENGATLSNAETDTFEITEVVIKIDGDLTTTGDLEVAGCIKIGTLNHAFMRFADSTSTYGFTQNNWQAISNATDSLFRKIEFEDLTYSGDSIMINYAADYDGILALSISGANNDVWEIRVNHEGSEISKMILKFGAQVDAGSITVPFYIYQASVGDYVVFEIRNTANGNDPTFNSGIVTMQYLHETD